MNEISVYTMKPKGRKFYVMRYRDPLDPAKEPQRSTGCKTKRQADKVAGVWEAELRAGIYRPPSAATWEDLIEAYSTTVLPGLAEGTATTYLATFNVFEKLAKPQRASDLCTERVSLFVRAMRTKQMSEATIARHQRTLKLLARWAKAC